MNNMKINYINNMKIKKIKKIKLNLNTINHLKI